MPISFIWPLALVIVSNILYSIAAKSIPELAHPLINVAVAYVVGAVVSVALYFLTEKNANIPQEISRLNWTSILLGVVIIGLEFGSISAYKAGWPVSRFFLVQSVCVSVALLIVGYFYREVLTVNKIIGMVICLVGLYFINR